VSGVRARAGQTRAGQAPAPTRAGGPPAGAPRSRWKAAFFVLAITGILAIVGWALLDSRFLIVRYVQVTGTGRLVSRSQVTAAAGIQLGVPLIRVDNAAVARRVERITQVQSAQVSKDWPDAVTIMVRQRTPVFAVPDGSGYSLVDQFGVAVTRAAKQPAGMPRLAAGTPGSPLRGSRSVRAAATVLRELPRRLAGQVTAVTAASPDEVSLRLASGVTVVWGGPERAAAKARELALLMRLHARRYDVSSPGTAMTQG
jgi:cell division protein FtsQ